MSFSVDMPESVGGSTMIEVAGRYHFVIDSIEENPTLGDKMVRGFQAEVTAYGGPASEIGKHCKLLFANGDMSHKDKGKFAREKQAAFLIATNLAAPSDLGKTGFTVELQNAQGHQFCAEIEMSARGDKGRMYPELRFSNIFHVDDPRAKAYPRDPETLELASEFRRKEEFFAPLIKSRPAQQKKVDDSDFEGL